MKLGSQSATHAFLNKKGIDTLGEAFEEKLNPKERIGFFYSVKMESVWFLWSIIPSKAWGTWQVGEHELRYKQDILIGLVQEKINWPGSEACWAETVGSRSRRDIPGPVQNKQAGPGTGIKILWSQFISLKKLYTLSIRNFLI